MKAIFVLTLFIISSISLMATGDSSEDLTDNYDNNDKTVSGTVNSTKNYNFFRQINLAYGLGLLDDDYDLNTIDLGICIAQQLNPFFQLRLEYDLGIDYDKITDIQLHSIYFGLGFGNSYRKSSQGFYANFLVMIGSTFVDRENGDDEECNCIAWKNGFELGYKNMAIFLTAENAYTNKNEFQQIALGLSYRFDMPEMIWK